MLVRVERFELIIKLVLSQPPLPIGLHAQIDLNLVLAEGFETYAVFGRHSFQTA